MTYFIPDEVPELQRKGRPESSVIPSLDSKLIPSLGRSHITTGCLTLFGVNESNERGVSRPSQVVRLAYKITRICLVSLGDPAILALLLMQKPPCKTAIKERLTAPVFSPYAL